MIPARSGRIPGLDNKRSQHLRHSKSPSSNEQMSPRPVLISVFWSSILFLLTQVYSRAAARTILPTKNKHLLIRSDREQQHPLRALFHLIGAVLCGFHGVKKLRCVFLPSIEFSNQMTCYSHSRLTYGISSVKLMLNNLILLEKNIYRQKINNATLFRRKGGVYHENLLEKKLPVLTITFIHSFMRLAIWHTEFA